MAQQLLDRLDLREVDWKRDENNQNTGEFSRIPEADGFIVGGRTLKQYKINPAPDSKRFVYFPDKTNTFIIKGYGDAGAWVSYGSITFYNHMGKEILTQEIRAR